MRGVRGWLRDTAGGLPSTFWYLWAGTLINRTGSFVVIFLAIYLTSARHFSAGYAGLVVGLFGAGGAAGTMVGGVLADRWGRRPTLLTAHLSAAAMMLALGFARERFTVAAGALLLGMAAQMARPAFSAMMVDVVPAPDRLRAFTLNYWAINLGFACASVLAGLAAQASYLLLFLVDASTTLAAAAIIFAKVREPRHDPLPLPPATAGGGQAGLRAVFGDRVFVGFVGLNVLVGLVFMQHLSTLPIAMGRDGLAPATYGSVIALNGVLIVAGQLFVPGLVRRRSRSHVLALAALIVGVGFGATAFAHTAVTYAVTVLIWTVGEMLNSPANSTLLAELSPTGLRGRYQGVFSLSWSVGAFVAPTAGGFVQQHVGNTQLGLGCGAIGLVVAALQLVSGPARERRARQLGAATAPATTPATAPRRTGRATPVPARRARPAPPATAGAGTAARTRSPARGRG